MDFVPVANLSAVVMGAVRAAMEMLPTDMTRDAVVETASAWVAWFLRLLWAWLIAARAGAVESLPEVAKRAAGSAVEASEPWVEMASTLLLRLYGSLVDAIVASKAGGGAQLLALIIPVVFLCGAAWALTCRTMKAPGLGGTRVPRAMFEASPKRYYATVRKARKAARRGASSGTSTGWKLLVAAPVVAYAAYLAANKLYQDP